MTSILSKTLLKYAVNITTSGVWEFLIPVSPGCWREFPDSIPTLAQCWFNVVHYDGPWPAYNLGPV